MMALAVSVAGATGVYLLYTSLAFGWRGVGPELRHSAGAVGRRSMARWLREAGMDEVRPAEFVAVVLALTVLGTAATFVVFGAPLPALAVGLFSGTFPFASYRARRRERRSKAQEAWPRMIEEIRMLVGSLGRSIPQALFEVGARGPAELRPAFAAARREWSISTDFNRTLRVLKDHMADPTADATCETLLVAHELGGTDLDLRLRALIEDRTQDVQGRKDARAKQAGVRFARRFVLVVPLGMAVAGMSVGNGRAAYATPTGQMAVVVGIALVVACWLWAGRIMAIPEEERVFEQ